MRKVLLATLVACISFVTIFVACKKETSNYSNDGKYAVMSGGIDDDLGYIHNLAMAQAKEYDGYDFGTESNTYQSIGNYTKSFMQQYPQYKNDNLIDELSNLCNFQILKNRVENIDNELNYLKEHEVISVTEFNLLSELKNLTLMNANGIIDNAHFQQEINAIYAENSSVLNDMIIVPSVLAIGIASCNYWITDDNLPTAPEEGGYQTMIAPWVASDMAGALVGSAIRAGIQYYRHGNVSLSSLAEGALIGAVSASLGLVGKAAKGISKWLN